MDTKPDSTELAPLVDSVLELIQGVVALHKTRKSQRLSPIGGSVVSDTAEAAKAVAILLVHHETKDLGLVKQIVRLVARIRRGNSMGPKEFKAEWSSLIYDSETFKYVLDGILPDAFCVELKTESAILMTWYGLSYLVYGSQIEEDEEDDAWPLDDCGVRGWIKFFKPELKMSCIKSKLEEKPASRDALSLPIHFLILSMVAHATAEFDTPDNNRLLAKSLEEMFEDYEGGDNYLMVLSHKLKRCSVRESRSEASVIPMFDFTRETNTIQSALGWYYEKRARIQKRREKAAKRK